MFSPLGGARRDRRGGVVESEPGGDVAALVLDRREPLQPQLVHLVPDRAAAWSTPGSGTRRSRRRRGAPTGRSSRWRAGGTRAAPPGSARTRGSRPRGPPRRSAPGRRDRRAPPPGPGSASASSASIRSICAIARSITSAGEVTPEATPSRATLRVGVQVRTEGPQPRLVAIEPLGRVGALQRAHLTQHLRRPAEVVGDAEPIHAVLQIGEEPGGDRLHHVERAALRDLERRPVDRDAARRAPPRCTASASRPTRLARDRSRRSSKRSSPIFVPRSGFELEQLLPVAIGERRGRVRCRSLLVLPCQRATAVTTGPGYRRRPPGARHR